MEEAQEVIFRPNPGPQTEFLAATEQEVLYGGAAGGGKAQPLYAKIATPTGWVTMGDISVGDVVSTPDGSSATVTQIHPQGVQDIYTVTTQDGSSCEVTDEHLFLCKPVRDGASRWKVRSVRELRDSKRTHVIPLGVVEREEVDLPIHPYVLGSLLGAGSISTNSISFATNDSESVEELKKYVEVTKRSSKYTYGILGLGGHLRDLNLLGTNSYTKFVPEAYKNGSLEQRLALLQGLMDTDGYVSADGKVNFTSMSEVLRNDVAELIRSVGGTATLMKGHTLYIRHPDSSTLFKLSRKKERCHKKVINNRIVSIKKSGRFEAKCITLSSEDSLYVTDNYLVTHNSFAMLADPVRYLDNPHSKMLLLRRTTEELRELISVSKTLYPKAIPGIKWLERDKTWVAPSGATLWMSYLDNDDDVLRYQGQAYNWIGFDELTQWRSPYAWDYMRSRLRTAKGSGLKLYMRATTNPGGPGHSWTKKMFIDPAPPGQAFWATDIDSGEVLTWPKGHSREGEPLLKRRFIPANLFDNPYLAEDGMYEANLLSLPEAQRKQLLEGSWDLNEGAAFPEFSRKLHVTESFDIPDNWVKFRACDYGYGSFTGVLWFAVVPRSEQLIVYRELYVSKVTASDLADMILEIEDGDRIRYGVLDSSLWHKRGDTGPSLAEQMIKKGCRWRPSDRSSGSRVAGKNEIHRRLQVDKFSEEPGLIIFDTCTNLISQLPSLPLDRKNPEDVDTKAEDHLYDALRYGIMSRPRDNRETSAPKTYRPVDSRFGY